MIDVDSVCEDNSNKDFSAVPSTETENKGPKDGSKTREREVVARCEDNVHLIKRATEEETNSQIPKKRKVDEREKETEMLYKDSTPSKAHELNSVGKRKREEKEVQLEPTKMGGTTQTKKRKLQEEVESEQLDKRNKTRDEIRSVTRIHKVSLQDNQQTEPMQLDSTENRSELVTQVETEVSGQTDEQLKSSVRFLPPFTEECVKTWSKARVQSWNQRHSSANSYYYRFTGTSHYSFDFSLLSRLICFVSIDPTVLQKEGTLSIEEKKLWLKRYEEFKNNGWRVGSAWGLFSKALSHR